eukprot:g13044.t1
MGAQLEEVKSHYIYKVLTICSLTIWSLHKILKEANVMEARLGKLEDTKDRMKDVITDGSPVSKVPAAVGIKNLHSDDRKQNQMAADFPVVCRGMDADSCFPANFANYPRNFTYRYHRLSLTVAGLCIDEEQREAAEKIFGHFLKPKAEAMQAALSRARQALREGGGRGDEVVPLPLGSEDKT